MHETLQARVPLFLYHIISYLDTTLWFPILKHFSLQIFYLKELVHA